MVRSKKTTLEGTVLLELRRQAGWTQRRLERTARLSRGTLTLYENGKRPLGRPLLNRLALTLGHSVEDVERALASLPQIPEPIVPEALTPASLLPHEWQAVEAAAERAAQRAAAIVRTAASARLIKARLLSERQTAANLWEELRTLPHRVRLNLVTTDSRFRSWALCELLCDESSREAARDAGITQNLAKLARAVAEKTPGGDAWQRRVQGYAWAFVGNALRVGGDLSLADDAFTRSSEMWGAADLASCSPLDGAQLLSLTASLRRAQNRFDDALALLSAAAQDDDPPEKRASLQIKLASIFERQGAYRQALATLEDARDSIADANQPRLSLSLDFMLAVNFCHLGEFEDALLFLGRVQRAALDLGNEIDIVRVGWLAARVEAGLGRKFEAAARLEQVRQAFLRRNITLDANLVALELAELRGTK